MIASDDLRDGNPGAPSPWPAMVREPMGGQPAARSPSTGGVSADAAANCNAQRAALDADARPPGANGASPISNGIPPGANGVTFLVSDEASSSNTAAPDAISAPSGPEPAEDGDELFLLGERIAELAARINAAESRMMALIADFDRRGGWKDGFGSCAEWLAWRIGIKIGSARERVRAARALEDLPQTARALREGQMSYAKVRALTRVATPGSEAELLEFARAGSAAKLEQMVRMWRTLSREGELKAEEVRHRNRAFSVFVDGDGMYVVRGRLEPEAGAVLMRAVEAASDALFRREDGPGDARPEPKQRRADAVGLLAERALAAGFGGGESIATPEAGPKSASSSESRVESGTRAERYQVVIHCDAATLAAEGEPGRSDLDGIRVSSETSRRMACDAAVVAMVRAERGPQDTDHPAAHPAGAGGA